MKVINYIRENLKIVDEIGTYNVYQKWYLHNSINFNKTLYNNEKI
jgi:hypothetical protein